MEKQRPDLGKKKSKPMTKKEWDTVPVKQSIKKQFESRTPSPRLGGKIDTTHIRFVDTATPKKLREEYRKVQAKESKLSANERRMITQMFQ